MLPGGTYFVLGGLVPTFVVPVVFPVGTGFNVPVCPGTVAGAVGCCGTSGLKSSGSSVLAPDAEDADGAAGAAGAVGAVGWAGAVDLTSGPGGNAPENARSAMSGGGEPLSAIFSAKPIAMVDIKNVAPTSAGTHRDLPAERRETGGGASISTGLRVVELISEAAAG